MKNILLFSFFLFHLLACNQAKEQKVYNKGINIVPKPQEINVQEGSFELTSKTGIRSFDANISNFFAAKIKQSTGISLVVKTGTETSNMIVIEQNPSLELNDEGYTLSVNQSGINIQAKTPQGAFYAMQTVMQLLPAEVESKTLVSDVDWKLPFVSIKDQPRFPYRGQHFDPCRHFQSVEYIKKQMDVLALFKINKFHWHLTDDQGWRIESKKYPKLNELSTVRTEGDGSKHGGYYTHEQIKEVVAYAKERFIEVIPEIELPGHAVAALTAYPELSCTGGPFEVRNTWGVSEDVFCAGNEATFQFLNDIFDEVAPLFESKYFHIGGDECPKTKWKACPKCQKRIKEHKLKDEHALQSYVVERAEKMLQVHGKTIIGWDEILDGDGLTPSAVVMSWRGEGGGIKAANAGHDVIMTPESFCYLNWYEGDSKILPIAFGYKISLESIYNYDPAPAAIADDKKHHILGTQGNVWSEYTYTPESVEYQTYPRILAIAETGWSAKEGKDYKDFERRINNQLVRLDGHQINYFIPLAEQVNGSCNWVAFVDSTQLELTSVRPVKIVYTLDGSEPNLQSTEYTKPISISTNTAVKVRSVLVSNKMSSVRTITFEKQAYQAATAIPPADQLKLTASLYKKGEKSPFKTMVVATPQEAPYVPGYKDPKPEDFIDIVVEGYLHVPQDGVYFFSTDCDEFWLNGKELISNKGEIKRHSRSDHSIALAAGYHPIKIIRVGEIFDGWPSMWNDVSVSVRLDKDPKFTKLTAEYFK